VSGDLTVTKRENERGAVVGKRMKTTQRPYDLDPMVSACRQKAHLGFTQ
jgi:hypothetical protein